MTTKTTVQCGDCAHFSRSPEGQGQCAVKGEGSRRWPFLIYPNFPIACADFEPREPEPEPLARAA